MLKPPSTVLAFNSSISLAKLKAKTTLPSVIDNTAGNYCLLELHVLTVFQDSTLL